MRPLFATVAMLATTAVTVSAQQPKPVNGSLPAVSPDGKRVAFISNRDGTSDLYVIDADGSGLTRLTNTPEVEGVPRWTSDGRVVYSRWASDTARIYAVNRDGTGATLLATIAETRDAALSPNGKQLLYSAGRFPRVTLTASNADGTGAHALAGEATGLIFNGVWSPDSKRIAYARADTARAPLNVWIANADGTGAKRITNLPESEGSPQWPDWSPDGQRVAVQVGKYNRNAPAENTAHIWVVDVNGVATKLAAHDKPYLDETPSWFPDGKRLAIQSDRTGRMEIWIISVDGKEAVQLTK